MIQDQIQRQIENYILGKLTANEIDKLWTEFLNVPEWYDYFITEIHLRALLTVDKSVSE